MGPGSHRGWEVRGRRRGERRAPGGNHRRHPCHVPPAFSCKKRKGRDVAPTGGRVQAAACPLLPVCPGRGTAWWPCGTRHSVSQRPGCRPDPALTPQTAACPTPASPGRPAAASPTGPGPVAPAPPASWATAPTAKTWTRWVPHPCGTGRGAQRAHPCSPRSAPWSRTSASPPASLLAASTPTPGSTACPAPRATRGPSPLAWAWRRPRLRSRWEPPCVCQGTRRNGGAGGGRPRARDRHRTRYCRKTELRVWGGHELAVTGRGAEPPPSPPLRACSTWDLAWGLELSVHGVPEDQGHRPRVSVAPHGPLAAPVYGGSSLLSHQGRVPKEPTPSARGWHSSCHLCRPSGGTCSPCCPSCWGRGPRVSQPAPPAGVGVPACPDQPSVAGV